MKTKCFPEVTVWFLERKLQELKHLKLFSREKKVQWTQVIVIMDEKNGDKIEKWQSSVFLLFFSYPVTWDNTYKLLQQRKYE